MTQKYNRLRKLFFWLSWSVTVFPLGLYVIKSFITGEPHHKLTLSCIMVIATILTFISILNKVVIRSTKWILILGVYTVLKNILPLLLMVAIGTIVDELILTPLYKKYREKYIINRTMDEREKHG